MPIGGFAQGGHAKQKAPAKKAAQAKKADNPGMVFMGQDGKMVDMKKDKCWNAVDKPYRAPGWC
jgi:hypothetical protein